MSHITGEHEDSKGLTLLILNGKIKGISWEHKTHPNQTHPYLAQIVVKGKEIASYIDFIQEGVRKAEDMVSEVRGIPFREMLGQDFSVVRSRLGAENVSYRTSLYVPPEQILNYFNN